MEIKDRKFSNPASLAAQPWQGWALITGGTSGIGYEFARQLAQRGMNIVLVARDEERLHARQAELQESYQVECEICAGDLADAAAVAKIKARLLAAENPITVFVNNAGCGLYARLSSTDYSEIRRAAEIMGLAPMELGGAAAVAMKERGAGVIINTSSIAALAPMGAYSAIKVLLKNFSDSLSLELQGTGVQVLTFLPSWVHTEFHARTGVSNSSIPNWVWKNPEEVVAEALTGVEKGKNTVIPARRIRMVAFLAKHLPDSLVRRAARKLNKGRR